MYVKIRGRERRETIFYQYDHRCWSIVISFSRKGTIAANVRVVEPFVNIELSAGTGRQSGGVFLLELL